MSSGKRSGGPTRKATTMMPVSVPKVLVRPPGQRQSEWVDLWEAYVSLGGTLEAVPVRSSISAMQVDVDQCMQPSEWVSYIHKLNSFVFAKS